jgi:predicted RNase H-like HicB family nuclease
MHRYEIIMIWSKEDNAFVADVPELLGCMAHGDTQEDALKNIKEAMSGWIEVAQELGRPIARALDVRIIWENCNLK